MAFSTIQGSGGAPDSFVGTSGVDSIVAVDSVGNYFLGAQEGNDNLNFNTTASTLYGRVVSNATIKGGAGTDTLTWASAANTIYSSAFINGNADRDTFTTIAGDSFLTSSILGGAANDTFTFAADMTATSLNGNKGIDTIDVTGEVSGSSVRGGQGGDLIELDGGQAITNTLVSGDLGNDRITIAAGGESLDGTTLSGGDGTDFITVNNVGDAGDVILVTGNAGVDTITLAAASTATSTSVLGGEGNDILTSGGAAAANAVTIIGGVGADQITAGGGADRVIYDAVDQGGASASGFSTSLVAAGDTLTGLDLGAVATDALSFSSDALVGTGEAVDTNGGDWVMNTTGVYFAAAADANINTTSTYRNVTDAINGALGVNGVEGDAGDVGYFIFDGSAGGAADDALVVQVTLGTTRTAGNATALDAGDAISVVAFGGAGTVLDGTINFI